MTLRILGTLKLTMPVPTDNGSSKILPRKIDMTEKYEYVLETADSDREILKGETFIDLFRWSLFGSSLLYFSMYCLNLLGR